MTHIDAASPYVKAEEHTDGNGNARAWKFFVEKIDCLAPGGRRFHRLWSVSDPGQRRTSERR